MKISSVIKQKSTRVIAFISACAIFAVCAYVALNKYFNFRRTYTKYDNSVINQYDTQERARTLFSELWVLGTMYYRNIDNDGNFTGSKELKESTENALRELGLMDEKGNITVGDDLFDFYVSWGNNSLSTDNKPYEAIFNSSEYAIMQENGGLSHGRLGYLNYNDYRYYTTKYGMTYYDFPNQINGLMGITTYDFDTTDCDYYTDRIGVKIYYKKDGSTPVPNMDTFRNNFNITLYNNKYAENYFNYNDYDYDSYMVRIDEETKKELAKAPEIPEELLTDENTMLIYNKEGQKWQTVVPDEVTWGVDTPIRICITPKVEIQAQLREINSEIDSAEKRMVQLFIALLPFVALSAVLMIYFIVVSGYDVKKKKYVLAGTDRIWAEVILAVIVCLILAFVMSFDRIDSHYMRAFVSNNYEGDTLLSMIFMLIWTVIFIGGVLCVNTLVKRFKCRSFYRTTFTRHIVNLLKKIFGRAFRHIKKTSSALEDIRHKKDMENNNLFARQFFRKSVIFIACMLFACMIRCRYEILLIITVAYVYLIMNDLKAMTELSRHIDAIYNGDYTPKEIDKNYPTYTLIEKLNNISNGVQTAVDKKLQSEKMKIDLVTNVSHDLKTPLTSIISYIDLLSEEELSPVARDYVKILEQKSARLSEIVADVFDIAKATSKTDINFEMLDVVILTEQVLADMADKIENSGKEIRKNINADNAPVYADGKRLYRVMQNLIDNALKYSLENTRIYITLDRESQNVIIKIKNISSYEITLSPEEITERFTRGDESRTTEGNGLGLSIAKSFTEACGGKFEVKIDGDVFTAIITMPIKEKES